jgi:CHAT domain-containing protein
MLLPEDARLGRDRYLVEWKPVHVAASVTVWEELKKRRRGGSTATPRQLLAFGDPRYTGENRPPGSAAPGSIQPGLPVRGLRSLPATRDEVLGIASLFGKMCRTHLGTEATEERAKAAGTGPDLIHFATHALLDPQVPLDSAIALSTPQEPAPGRDNGLLQAWEIFEALRIEADLVTLSGCETALGQEMEGEGIIGLTRAFQYAGARSVLASLWSVTDRSTAGLMQRFYTHLQAGQSMDEALRAAQLDLIRAPGRDAGDEKVTRGVKALVKNAGSQPYAAPYHWAAFQLIGDWR